jgi:hypothetical protein
MRPADALLARSHQAAGSVIERRVFPWRDGLVPARDKAAARSFGSPTAVNGPGCTEVARGTGAADQPGGRGPGPAVEHGSGKGSRVAGKPVADGKPRRVQFRMPVIVTPSRRTDPDDHRGLSPRWRYHEVDASPPGSRLVPSWVLGGMSASTKAVDPAGRAMVSSVRSRRRSSDSASPSGTVASRRELACTPGRSMTASTKLARLPGVCARTRGAAMSGRSPRHAPQQSPRPRRPSGHRL